MKNFNLPSWKSIVNMLLFATMFLFPISAYSQTTANEWLLEIDRNLNPPQYESYRKLINIEPDGSKKEFVLFSLKQGREKMVSLFLSPASEKGRSTLRVGENMWLYIPAVGRALRITSLQSVTGGIFNNSDILRVDYQTEYDAVSLVESEKKAKSGKNYLQLDLKAKSGSVAYDKLEMLIDTELKSPIEIKAITSSGMLIKTIYFKNIKDFGNGIKRPSVVETDSPLHKGYQSIMIFAKMKPRELDEAVFTTDYLGRIETLR